MTELESIWDTAFAAIENVLNSGVTDPNGMAAEDYSTLETKGKTQSDNSVNYNTDATTKATAAKSNFDDPPEAESALEASINRVMRSEVTYTADQTMQ